MPISNTTIAEINNHIRIEEVLGDFITFKIKRSGQNLWACCPFPSHQERTPSFAVRPDQGFYKCFGCGEIGNAITFLKKVQGMDYVEAMRYLARKYQVPWITEKGASNSDALERKKEGLFLLMEQAEAYYQKILKGSTTAQAYLSARGITNELIQRFHLGYSRDAWRAFHAFAIQEKAYTPAMLEEVGLVIAKEGQVYDRFRGRIMFPIHDAAGRVVGFGGRQLQEPAEGAKYINSPETSIYRKTHVLYGIYQAKQAIRKAGFCYLVEGYTDVLALHSLGIEQVVASAGTSLTVEQVTFLKRFTKKVTLLFDGDEAGLKAIFRGVDFLLAQGLEAQIVGLPSGEDPASYAQKLGAQPFSDYLTTHSQDFVSFKLKHLLSETQDPQKKAAAVHEVIHSIAVIPDEIQQAVYVTLCSKLTGIAENTIQTALGKAFRTKEVKKASKSSPHALQRLTTPRGEAREEVAILSLLLHYGNEVLAGEKLADIIFEELEEIILTGSTYQRAFHLLLSQWREQSQIIPTTLLQDQPEKMKKIIIDLMTQPHSIYTYRPAVSLPSGHQEKKLQHIVYQNILRLKLKVVKRLGQEAYNQLKTLEKDESLTKLQKEKAIDEQLTLYDRLKKVEIEIAQRLGIVTYPSEKSS